MTISISTKGQIVLPVAIRQRDGIEPGQLFEVRRVGRGQYLLKRVARKPGSEKVSG
jgi:AbrB family looped-hinge helix DNA binding protein